MPFCPQCRRWFTVNSWAKPTMTCKHCGSTIRMVKKRAIIARALLLVTLLSSPWLLIYFFDEEFIASHVIIIAIILIGIFMQIYNLILKYEVVEKGIDWDKKPWE